MKMDEHDPFIDDKLINMMIYLAKMMILQSLAINAKGDAFFPLTFQDHQWI